MHVIGESLTDTRVAAPQAVSVGWSLSTRLAFRFCVAYFTLYVLATQMLTRLVDLSGFRLLQSRFRWLQDYPFNR